MIEVTNEANRKAVQKLSLKGREALYLGMVSSGCAGYSYILHYSSGANLRTHTKLSLGDLTIYIDNKSIPLLKGMTLDYVYEGLNEGFKFINPNLPTECGCGQSVNV
jgi:iron-sulfur cluster assembly protein